MLPSALGDKLPRWDFVVPMGLSYFIFQAVGYVIDVYRGKTDAQKNPLRYGLFVSFFPQMVQGPISRYDLSRLADYALWVADYNDYPDFYYAFDMWQYSDSAALNGMPTQADLNLLFVPSPRA